MSTQYLTLVRHGKSELKLPNQSDRQRKLDERGIKDAADMAQRLKALSCIPELILCSSAQRTRETAGHFNLVFQLTHDQIIYRDQLYLSSPSTLLQTLKTVPSTIKHVMIIGHNPGLEDLSAQFSRQCRLGMPTLGVRHFACTSIQDPLGLTTDETLDTPTVGGANAPSPKAPASTSLIFMESP